MPKEFIIKDFTDLPRDQIERFGSKANWKIDGENGSWSSLADPDYGVDIKHIAVMTPSGDIAFDKINIAGTQGRPGGVFVTVARYNPNLRLMEFLLVKESRMLLKDPNNEQGKRIVENIPQGGYKSGETYGQASAREVIEETGHTPTGMALIGRVALDHANTEVENAFVLALVPFHQQAQEVQQEEGSHLESKSWYTMEDWEKKQFVDSKTLVARTLARQTINHRFLYKSENRLISGLNKIKQRFL